mgnify:CR=1 FL=1
MKYILATHNDNKAKEIKELFKNKIEIITLKDLNDYEEIIEDGKTFEENALIKAKTIFKKYNLPVIADDSGLEIKYLNNLPGVYSQRYSGKGDLENNKKVLRELKDVSNRDARFVCVIALVEQNGDTKVFKGMLEGEISLSSKGNNGFGYDPIFIPKGYTKTLGELPSEIKQKISHRSQALLLFEQYLLK